MSAEDMLDPLLLPHVRWRAPQENFSFGRLQVSQPRLRDCSVLIRSEFWHHRPCYTLGESASTDTDPLQ